MELESVCIALDELSKDSSVPKNVKAVLNEIKLSLNCSKDQMPVKINAALQKLEALSMDSNLSMFGRTAIWGLTSELECVNCKL